MITDPAIATAADYADALITARRAKNLLLLIVLLLLLLELAIFFVAKYTDLIIPSAAAATAPSARCSDALQYLTGLSAFLGVALSVVLSLVLYLIVQIMLVGRLIGVARVTGAFVISLLTLVLLFPWQAFLGNSTFSDPSFKPPGVLYIWSELLHSAKLGVGAEKVGAETPDVFVLILHWARFVGFPLLGVILLLMIQVKSNRGLRQALGEDAAVDDNLADTPPSA